MRIFPQRFLTGFFLSIKDFYTLTIAVSALFCFVSLFSFHVFDNSFNTSSHEVTKNWLGTTGAYVADFLWQFLGAFAYLIPIIALMFCVKTLLNSFNRYWNFSLSLMVLGILQLMICSSYYQATFKATFAIAGVIGLLLKKALIKLFCMYFAKEWFDEFAFALGISGLICTISSLGISDEFIKNTYLAIKKRFFKTQNIYDRSYDFVKENWLKNNNEPTKISSIHINEMDPEFDDVKPLLAHPDNTEINSEPEAKDEDKSETEIVNNKKIKAIKNFQFNDDGYTLPPIDLLSDTNINKKLFVDNQELQNQSSTLMAVLEEFGVKGEISNIRSGPVVTMFELKPAAGIKTARVIGLADDIARSMSAISARIANIPGQNVIGIELPNKKRQTVYMRDLLLHDEFKNTNSTLPLVLGQDIVGKPIIADLAKMPHLLVAGTTGSGKSVSVNAMICSILFRLSPDECRFIMIDPKMLELSVYNDIPHLLTPVVTEPKKAIVALKWAVKEMENRYRNMSKLGVRNIDGYNQRIKQARANGEVMTRRVQTGFDPDTGQAIFENQVLDLKPLPYIIVVIDEMADLMLVAGKEVEAAVQRLAQMARAAGLHLIMATQRPSVDVITGTIKANFPTRISFQVTSRIDSRTILGEQGAEQLLGQGDMLYMGGAGRLTRVHGPFMKDSDVEEIVSFLKQQGEPDYIDDVTTDTEDLFSASGSDTPDGGDVLFNQAVDLVRTNKKVSTSSIQRHFQIGYNRAARIVDLMEKQGIVSEANHQGKREVLI